MRLSDAIAMGRTLINEPSSNTFCRCAIGMGLAGTGYGFHEPGNYRARTQHAAQVALYEWPWLTEIRSIPDWYRFSDDYCLSDDHDADYFWGVVENAAINVISVGFVHVRREKMTLDQLIDWVRSVEPNEPEPQQEAVPELAAVAQPR